MTSSPLLSKPSFVSQFSVPYRPEYQAAVAKRVHEYFSSNWPWASERQKQMYSQMDTQVGALLVCPRVPEDRAEVMAELLVWGFALDDVLETLAPDKVVKLVEGLKGVLLDGHPPQNAIEKMTHDIRSRMLSFGDDHTREHTNRIFTGIANYMDAVKNDVERRKIVKQGFADYLKYRVKDAGMSAMIPLCAWGLDLFTPPEHISGDPDFGVLLSLTSEHVVLVNDLYSYRREALGGWNLAGENQDGKEYVVCNAVCVLLREDGVDETNVMDKLGAHISRRESDFISTEERLIDRYKGRTDDLDVIQKWVRFLKEMMGGVHYYSSTSRRYNRSDDTLSDNE